MSVVTDLSVVTEISVLIDMSVLYLFPFLMREYVIHSPF